MTSAFSSRLDGAVTGLAIKAPVRVATTANITLSGAQTIDGVAVVAGDRVLVKSQSTTTENGIYDVAASTWVRSADFSGTRDVAQGTVVRVVSGTVHADQWWQVATASPVIGSAIEFTQVSDIILAGFVQVTDYGAVGDGATDNTTAITSAVAAADAGGLVLHWPAGSYLTTASVPLLHSVRHFGPGAIVRGLDTFYLDPDRSATNTLYVSASGSALNDGLSSGEPMTPQAACNALREYGPVLDGTWVINAAAGTYSRPTMIFPSQISPRNAIQIVGAATGDFRSVPTTIFDGEEAAGTCIAGTNLATVKIKDILIKDWYTTAPDFNAGAFSGVGIDFYNSQVSLENVHVSACDCGLYMKSSTRYLVKGGIIDGCGAGVQELFDVVRDFKQAGSTDNRTTISNCEYGVKAKEGCVGHLDYLELLDNTYGVHLARISSGNMTNAILKRNTVGVYGMAGCSFVDLNVTWGTGADANGVKFSIDATSIEIMRNGGENAQSSLFPGKGGKLIGNDVTQLAHTGTTSDTLVAQFHQTTVGEFQSVGEWYECVAYGSCVLASTATLRFRVGSNGAASLTMPTGTYGWVARWRFTSRGPDTQISCGELLPNGGSPVIAVNARAYTFSTVEYLFGVYVQLVSGSDSVTIEGAHLMSSEM